MSFSSEEEADTADWAGPHYIGGMEVEAKRVVSLKVNQNRALGNDLLNESAMFLCHINQKSKYDDVESTWKTDWIHKKCSVDMVVCRLLLSSTCSQSYRYMSLSGSQVFQHQSSLKSQQGESESNLKSLSS